MNAGKAVGAFAGDNVDYGDHEVHAKAMAADINSRGGLAGRKIELVFYDVDVSQGERVAQVACAKWTEDRPVFAVVNVQPALADDHLAPCLAKRNTLLIAPGGPERPQSFFARYSPYFYSPAGVTLERLTAVWVRRLNALGYFKGGWDADPAKPGVQPTKVGIVATDVFHGRDFIRIVSGQLKRQGHQVAATYETSGGFKNESNEMQQAVLRFRRVDVTHVVVGANTEAGFSRAAASADYHPRLAFNSSNVMATQQRSIPERQLRGALGVGHIPTMDVDNAHDPGDVSAAQTRCRRIMEDARQDTSNREAFRQMVRSCDGFNYLAAAVEKGGLSIAGIRRGTQAIDSMPAASTFRMSFPNARTDGASVARDLGYRSDCSCAVYLSRTNHAM